MVHIPVRPSAKLTDTGFSRALNALNTFVLAERTRKARKAPRAIPTTDPIAACDLNFAAATLSVSRSVSSKSLLKCSSASFPSWSPYVLRKKANASLDIVIVVGDELWAVRMCVSCSPRAE